MYATEAVRLTVIGRADNKLFDSLIADIKAVASRGECQVAAPIDMSTSLQSRFNDMGYRLIDCDSHLAIDWEHKMPGWKCTDDLPFLI